MIIQLTPEIAYDTNKVFEQQTDECKAFIADYKTKVTPVYPYDETGRPTKGIWNNINWNIVDTQKWVNTTSWESTGVVTTVEEIELWFDKTRPIQAVVTDDENYELLKAAPEMAVLIKETNVPSFRVNRKVFLYMLTLEPQYRQILEAFGAEITTKEIGEQI